jgi:hypothetical protein
MGIAGWAALPEGTSVEFMTASASAGVGPSERLMDMADRVCDIFILGQTLTTDVADSGSRALGDVHADVKDNVVRSVCDFVAEMLNSQWVNTLISLNYGEPNPQEVPELVPDIEDPVDEMAMAQRDLILINQIGMEVPKDWLFKRHRVPELTDASELFKPVAAPNPLLTHQTQPGANGAAPGQNGGELNPDLAQLVHGADPYHDKKGRFASDADPDTGATHDNTGVLNEALSKHGETKDFKESGYVLPNGKMLNMSGGEKGRRVFSHQGVQITKSSDGRTKVDQMLDAGSVRISSDEQFGGMIHAGQHPVTSEQLSSIKKLIGHHNGKVYVAVEDKDRKTLHDRGYDEGTSHTKILGDIQRAQRGEKIQSSTEPVSTES